MRYACPICNVAFNHPSEHIWLSDGTLLYRCPSCEALLKKALFTELPHPCKDCRRKLCDTAEPGDEICCYIGSIGDCPSYRGRSDERMEAFDLEGDRAGSAEVLRHIRILRYHPGAVRDAAGIREEIIGGEGMKGYIPHADQLPFRCGRCGSTEFVSYPQTVPVDRSKGWTYEYHCMKCDQIMGLTIRGDDE